jgi:hypothetical protein
MGHWVHIVCRWVVWQSSSTFWLVWWLMNLPDPICVVVILHLMGANFLGPALLFLAYNSTHNPCVLGIEPQCRSWVFVILVDNTGCQVDNTGCLSPACQWSYLSKFSLIEGCLKIAIFTQRSCWLYTTENGLFRISQFQKFMCWYWFYSCAHLSRTWWKVFTKALKDDTSYSAFEVPLSTEGKPQAESISCKHDINISSLWILESSAPSCLWHPSIFWTFE